MKGEHGHPEMYIVLLIQIVIVLWLWFVLVWPMLKWIMGG